MQRIVLITIGKVKESWAKDACTFYGDRLKHALKKFDIIELPASRESDSKRQMIDESERILKFLKGYDAEIYILDERGKGMKSPAFAKTINDAKDAGRTIVFVLGGAYGLTADVRSKGSLLKLSDMVLPHELCRVVFLEQLYRATEIMKGSGYHH
jgi:23S rRNA (pseudouridine1915-N3)-methyltransferase